MQNRRQDKSQNKSQNTPTTAPNGTAPSARQLRVGELVRARLSAVLQRGDFFLDSADFRKTGAAKATPSITISEVRISPDLRHARAYIMPLGGGDVGDILGVLNEHAGRIKHQALTGLRLRYMPNIRFFADESFERGAAMDALLSKLPTIADEQ